jgi:hypothetical protein
VHLRGFVDNWHDHEGERIFKLPEGCTAATPAVHTVAAFSSDDNGSFAHLEIENDQVRVKDPGAFNKIHLDGVTFRAK